MHTSASKTKDTHTEIFNRWRLPVLVTLVTVMWLGPVNQGQAAETGEQIFQSKCTACHTIGKGKLVGPDLAGVTMRREESWLSRQIKEPDRLLAESDPIALRLLQEANNVPMVPLGMSDAEVAAVIGYLKSTEQQENVETGLPSQYMPTIFFGLLAIVGLTFAGLKLGTKKVDPR